MRYATLLQLLTHPIRYFITSVNHADQRYYSQVDSSDIAQISPNDIALGGNVSEVVCKYCITGTSDIAGGARRILWFVEEVGQHGGISKN